MWHIRLLIMPITDSPPDPSLAAAVTIDDVRSAAERIKGVAHKTLVMTSRSVNERTGAAQVFFKCENFQRVGAFKFRGAYNALSRLDEGQRSRGVLTFSSGNHAQAIALASKLLGISATIVMPSDAPRVKLDATRGYLEGTGGEVILYERSETSREALGDKIAKERGLTVVSPYDHPHIIAGQGTAALELIEEVGELDALFAPLGGGGLLSGSATAAKALLPNCKVFGVEPANADDGARSFKEKRFVIIENPDTIADGARTPHLGQYTLPIILERVDDIITVSEREIASAMFYIWERMKIVIEPTGALGFAGLLKTAKQWRGKHIGIIISGGNIDPARVPELLEVASR